MRILFTFWCGLISLCGSLKAAPNAEKMGDTDSLKTASAAVQNLGIDASNINIHTFPDLEKYLKDNGVNNSVPVHQGYDAPEFTKAYIDNNFTVSESMNDARNQAQSVIDEIVRKGSFVENLSPSNFVDLPVGLKKPLGNSSVIIGLASVKLFSTYAELLIFCKIDLPQGKSILFGANNVKMSYKGGFIGSPTLVLLGDFQIPINGGNMMITLKGGLDMETGNVANKTAIKFTCGGIESVSVDADVSFPRSLLVPLNADYTVVSDPNAKVQGHFSTTVNDWNNIYASNISLQPFAIKGLERVAFQITNAVFDFSDFQSPTLPADYVSLLPGDKNLWRGVYIQNLSVILPKEFKKKGSASRITFEANNLLVDNLGLTGAFSASNILTAGSASGWDFSVDKFMIDIQTNRVRSAGFEGSIALPVSKKTASGMIKDYGLAYQAIFSPDNGYVLRVGLNNDVSFDLWKAKAKLKTGSYVELALKDDAFRPKAFLNGDLNFSITNGATADATFNGITFTGLQLQTVVPYIQADYFGYATTTNKVSNFPVSISSFKLAIQNGNEVALNAGIDLNLMEFGQNKIQASTIVSIVGKLNQDNEGVSYDYDRLDVNKLGIVADFKSFSIDGYVEIFKSSTNPIMGNGFAGKLGLKLKLVGDGVSVDAVAAFGKRDGFADEAQNFRYWYVDLLVGGLNIPVAGPAFVINGLGGGASYKMKKVNSVIADNTICPSGMGYVPDANTGLGLRAMAMFTVGSKSVAAGNATLEMTFTSSGGLQKIGFHGKAIVMPSGSIKDAFGSKAALESKVKTQYAGLVSKISTNEADYNAKAGSGDFKNLAKDYTQSSQGEGEGSIVATVGIEYDFTNKVLDGNFEVYMNLANGSIKGVGEKNLAGYAKIRFTPDKWYILMGTPQNPIGVKMSLLGVNITTTSYFMVGDSLGASPPPPAIVANILGVKLQALDYMRNLNDLGGGRGFAFGAKIDVNTGRMNWLIFYAQFQAGIGFDIMVKDYGNTTCSASTGPIGMNGWYANGQAYAYLQGELGIHIDLIFYSGDISLISAGAAVLLQAKLPNPSWFSGYVGGRYSLLGGIVEGSFSCNVKFGTECEISQTPQFEIISDIFPANNAEEVDVLSNVQATFRLPLESKFIGDQATDQSGNPVFYKALITKFEVTNQQGQVLLPNGASYPSFSFNSRKDVSTYSTGKTLPSNTVLNSNIEVSIYRCMDYYCSNKQYVTKESKTITFKTGLDAANIPLSNIANTYPVINQKYFLPKEYYRGFIKTKTKQENLLSANFKLKVVFVDNKGTKTTADAVYDYGGGLVYDLPVLMTNQSYTLNLWSLPTGATTVDSLSGGKKILVYKFNTSNFNTFPEKIATKKANDFYKIDLGAAGFGLGNSVYASEPFDIAELKGSRYSNFQPLVKPRALLSENDYFNLKPYKINCLK